MDSTTPVCASNSTKKAGFNLLHCLLALTLSLGMSACHSRAAAPAKIRPVPTRDTSALPYYQSADFTPLWLKPGDKRLQTLHAIGPFSLTSHRQTQITQRTLTGKIVVANFFYPTCHGICPATMRNLKRVQKTFANDTDVVILSHCLTPDTDTPELLRHYARQQGITSPNWHLLTGEKTALFQHARQNFFADEDLGKKTGEDSFLHSENFFLVDQEGRLRGLYSGVMPRDVELLISDLRLLKRNT